MDGIAANSLSSTRRSLRLPRELIREILRFFCDDEWALQQYALVSRDWLLESRPFLFRNIDICDRDPLELFVSNVLHAERLRPWLTSIHHLSIYLSLKEESLIADISERLSNLRTLTWALSPCQPSCPLSAKVLHALGQFSRLQQLELFQHDSLASFEDLKKIIVAFPALSSLTLFGAAWSGSSRPNEPSSDPLALLAPDGYARPKLTKVSAPMAHRDTKQFTDDVLLWLSTTPPQYLLRELSVDACNLPAALRLIAGRSLTALDVKFEKEAPELLGNVTPISSSESTSHTQFARPQVTTTLRPNSGAWRRRSATSSSSVSTSRFAAAMSSWSQSFKFSAYSHPPPPSAASASAATVPGPMSPSMTRPSSMRTASSWSKRSHLRILRTARSAPSVRPSLRCTIRKGPICSGNTMLRCASGCGVRSLSCTGGASRRCTCTSGLLILVLSSRASGSYLRHCGSNDYSFGPAGWVRDLCKPDFPDDYPQGSC